MKRTAAVILAAGEGKRMKSDLPKVLHPILDRPMVSFVIDSVKRVAPDKTILVIGYQAERVREACRGADVEFVLQEEQLGTGHAVLQCEEALSGFDGTVMVLNGDVPCLRTETLRGFIDFHDGQGAVGTVLTAVLPDATGYGRIVRGAGDKLLRIVEHKDATEEELAIREINSGLFCFDKAALFEALQGTGRDNVQKEYYLTDAIELMRREGLKVAAWRVDDEREVSGVNTLDELQAVARIIEGAI
jgi:bifunctional UDP-N-acetylglucosamine pyrophosphorylase/glucosamine-1-phosphate N-acetyltransferase